MLKEFVDQSDALDFGLLQIIYGEAQRLGVTEEFVTNTVQDSEYGRRERVTFLNAVNFLTLHELCHVALEHGSEEAKRRGPETLELDADRCALDIINRDEARFRSSPVSFFGALMIVSTQIVVNEVAQNVSNQYHPSTRERLRHTGDLVLGFLAGSGSDDTDRYVEVIQGTLDYLDGLLARYSAP